jgi:predicted NodU family carbamoyl transferase
MKYFNYTTGLTMTNKLFDRLFGAPARQPEAELTQREMDIAASIQQVTEEIVLRLANTAQKELEVDYLCLAGGLPSIVLLMVAYYGKANLKIFGFNLRRGMRVARSVQPCRFGITI